jgi:hypothetical protein
MDATSFELNATFPADERFVETMRAMAEHAARYAGCRGDDAEKYGTVVELVASFCLAGITPGSSVDVIVRRGDGPVEFLIAGGRKFASGTSGHPHITVDWTRYANREMCRIARDMPHE